MNEVVFNYKFKKLESLLDKYMDMQDLIEEFFSQNSGTADFHIKIGEKEFILIVVCRKV